MATVTTPPQHGDRDDSQRRVAHPLQRLRGYIRYYVTAEGLAILGLYIALVFWVGLLVDFGFFKLFGVDWVQAAPRDLRVFVLCALTAGLLVLVTFKMLIRLLREFRDNALALVLERRFPKDLGDRLITAVEMADPKIGERYGYSQLMIEQTIRDAAERVDRLPVGDVFDWRRLRRYGLLVAAVTVGLYLLVGAAYCALAPAGVSDFAVRFHNIATIWFERNILLRDTIWPRQAHLELVGFPESGELKIGRDAPPPALRVRALKWVIADTSAAEGWRCLRWRDVSADLLGAPSVPGQPPAEWQDWTMDEIELALEKPEAHASLDANTRLALRDVFAQLEAQATAPRMARRLRMLRIPDLVTVYYRGDTIRSEQTLKKQADNQYSGVLTDLRESVRFTANGEDYYTPYKTIIVVPPPSLVELTRDEDQPAYLYHRPPLGGQPKDLRGKKQEFLGVPISLSGNASRIEIPAGTNITLKGKTDKALQVPNGVRLRAREGNAAIKAQVRQADPQSFEVRFENVTAPIDFVFEFTDTDNVIGSRPVVIKPIDDTPPDVDVQVEVLRKVNQTYLVSVGGKIPFSGKIRDDHGLQDVEYVYNLTSPAAQALANAKAVTSLLQFTPCGVGAEWLAGPYLSVVAASVRSPAEDTSRRPERLRLGTFARRAKELSVDDETPDVLEKHLHEKPEQTLLRDHTLDPEEEAFDVEKLGLKVSDELQFQPQYRLRLWVDATDNNIETGPGVGSSKEKFNFLIVSENELLLEIAKEEESLHIKLEDAVNKLKEARNKVEQVSQELPSLKPEEFSPMARRAEEIQETLVKSWDVSREVHQDYRKILKELMVNRVRDQIIKKVDTAICEPLDGAINQEFVRADEATQAFHKMLEEKKADLPTTNATKEKLDTLIDRLTRILDAMGDITTINKIIEQLTQIVASEGKAGERYKQLSDSLQEKILDQAFTPDKPPEKKP
ncbi:MAG TPA: hypothetical protein VK395_07765 [Gemmataceae bacterium]|nr:hypothetical protein [Gemmataceae bacterium]